VAKRVGPLKERTADGGATNKELAWNFLEALTKAPVFTEK